MKKIIISLFIILILFAGCLSSDDEKEQQDNSETAIKYKDIKMLNTETYEYFTGISGSKDAAFISQQALHFENSAIIKNSTTNWETVYTYKPLPGFTGTEKIILRFEQGLNEKGTPGLITLVYLKIQVSEK